MGFGHIDLGSKRPDVCAGWATWAECQRRVVEGINGAYQLPMVVWLQMQSSWFQLKPAMDFCFSGVVTIVLHCCASIVAGNVMQLILVLFAPVGARESTIQWLLDVASEKSEAITFS